MTKILIFLMVMMFAVYAKAAINDIYETQEISGGGTFQRFLSPPPNGENGIRAYDGATQRSVHNVLGPGLSMGGGTISVAASTIGFALMTATTQVSARSAIDAFQQPTGTTAQYIRGDGSLATFPAAASRVFNYPARTLNTCFQPSATRDSVVTYSVDIAATLSLTGGQTGTVFLRTYTDASCTTGAQEISRFVNGNTGTLTIGLNITQNATGAISGMIPAGAYARIDTTGTATFTYRSAQEVLQ